MDLREEKHWTYGASGNFSRNAFAAPYVLSTPVQADKTGPALAAMKQDVAAYLTTAPMTAAEFERSINSATRSL
ncbi:hypothetical protein LTR94_038600, partial [Friedmanniomyces endolithicus]